MKQFFKYVLAFAMIMAGINHFLNPPIYLSIMPTYLPAPLFLVYLSGVLETVLGILLLIPALTPFAAWGLMILFVAIFPANLNMALHPERYSIPELLLWLRLPLQGLLISWAYVYTNRDISRLKVEG
jgi:uncharacterized membrane protein